MFPGIAPYRTRHVIISHCLGSRTVPPLMFARFERPRRQFWKVPAWNESTAFDGTHVLWQSNCWGINACWFGICSTRWIGDVLQILERNVGFYPCHWELTWLVWLELAVAYNSHSCIWTDKFHCATKLVWLPGCLDTREFRGGNIQNPGWNLVPHSRLYVAYVVVDIHTPFAFIHHFNLRQISFPCNQFQPPAMRLCTVRGSRRQEGCSQFRIWFCLNLFDR